MRQFQWCRKSWVLVYMSALLTACGGGDGESGILIGGSETGQTVNKQTADGLMRTVLFNSEKILQLSQVAVDAAERLLANDLMTITVNCATGGAITMELVDADNNGQFSNGDSISMNYEGCFDSVLTGSVVGELLVTVSEVSLVNQVNGLAQLQSISGGLQTVGLLNIDDNANQLTIDAEFTFGFDRISATNLSARANIDQTVVITSDGSNEIYSNFDLQKNVADTVDRYELELELDVDSERFNTRLRCSDFNLQGLTDFVPDSGELTCQVTDETVVALRADSLPALEIDIEGDGFFESIEQPSRLFNDAVDGFLYARP